jgi:hypothetical protein
MRTLEEMTTVPSQQNDLQRAKERLEQLNDERKTKRNYSPEAQKLDTQIQLLKNVVSVLEWREQ